MAGPIFLFYFGKMISDSQGPRRGMDGSSLKAERGQRHIQWRLLISYQQREGSFSSFIPSYCCFPHEHLTLTLGTAVRSEAQPIWGSSTFRVCMQGASTLVSGQSPGEALPLCVLGRVVESGLEGALSSSLLLAE